MVSDSWIQIKKIQVSRQQKVPEQVYFYFNENLLREIQLSQENHQNIVFSEEILKDFNHYALFNHKTCFPVELSFCSFYQENEEPIAIIKSVIALDGKIIQKIRHDYLEKPQLLQKIIKAHYVVIEQILNQIKLKHSSDRFVKSKTDQEQTSDCISKKNQDRQLFSWSLSLGLAVIVAIILSLNSINLLLILLITILLALTIKIAMKYLLLSNFIDLFLQKSFFSRLIYSNKIKK